LVVWEALADESGVAVGAWPLPEALRGMPRIAYVGGEAERGLLELARSEARSGARRLVFLSGEPGIGKTRLASYGAMGANADGFAVCWGRAVRISRCRMSRGSRSARNWSSTLRMYLRGRSRHCVHNKVHLPYGENGACSGVPK